jgi:hypothetical protein
MKPVNYLSVSRSAWSSALSMIALVAVAPVASADALGDAIAGGKTSLELRYRFEDVEQEPFTENANASTLRTRLRYSTGEWQSMTALIELDNLSVVGEERYNNTRNGETTLPVVADPRGADLNQALIKYIGISNTVLTAGRQKVNLDNQRFVGSVAWRQNEQTLDGGIIEYKGIDRLTATYGFVSRVNRVFGPQPGAGATVSEFEGDSHLINLKYVLSEKFSGVIYDYLLDLDNPTVASGLSSQTAGVRLAGKIPVSKLKLGYTAEYARQSAYKDNPASFDAPYMLGELTFGGTFEAGSWETQAGYEVLGEDNGVAVQTPLATLHKFQGWADKFQTTPTVGLIDSYIGATLTVYGYGFNVVAHQYEGDANGADYGDEINVQLSKTFAKRYTLTAKYADYSTGDVVAVTDTTKYWLMAEAKF